MLAMSCTASVAVCHGRTANSRFPAHSGHPVGSDLSRREAPFNVQALR